MSARRVYKEDPAQNPVQSFDSEQNALPKDPRIDAIVDAHMATLRSRLRSNEDPDLVPGLAVSVRKDNDIVHLNSYGYANLETRAKVTPDTIFDLGSLSKQFTAIAILDLVNRNKLDLNDPLSKFFKGFPRYADDVTIEDLVHHKSGLPDYLEIYVESRRAEKGWYELAQERADEWYPLMSAGTKEITNRDVLKWIARQTLLPKPPDTEFKYSNTGYVVLAELVRRITRKRFSSLLKDQLFGPYGMKNTYVFDQATRFSPDAPEIVNHARCYNRVGNGFVPVGYTPLNFLTGDGNVHSSISDLARWENLLTELDDLSVRTDTNVRERLWTPVKLKSRKQVNYGWGWHLLSDKYEAKVRGKGIVRKFESRAEYHRGVWLAWRSYIARGSRWVIPRKGRDIDPKTFESLGIIVLSNSNQYRTCRIAKEISRVFWGPLKKDNIMNNFDC